MSTWGKNYPNQLPKKNWVLQEARGKLETYCAYQERCVWEVRRKLFEKGITSEPAENLIDELVRDGFLDEERFARSFARGKFRLKKWGRKRTTRELKLREISPKDIREALAEIDPEEYYDTLLSQTERQWEKTKEKDHFKKRYLIFQYLIGKGYEEDLIREALESIQP
jgi:regulatory protein